MEPFEKVTLHLRPLSKEGTFIETRLTTGKRTAQARRFVQLEKKASEKIVGSIFRTIFAPPFEGSSLQNVAREIVGRFSSKSFEETCKQTYLCRPLLTEHLKEADSSADIDKRSLT